MTTKTKSDFYDFSSKPVLIWKIQSFIFPKVLYYYDSAQKSWCRRVKDVKGRIVCNTIRGGKFFKPDPNLIVNYSQVIY